MPTFIIYLIKANIALTLFYSAYRFGLCRLTFYTLNRFFLLFGIAFSAAFPLASLNSFFDRHAQIAGNITYYAPDWNALRLAQPQNPFTTWNIVEYIFWAGVIIMAVRLSIQLFSLLRIHLQTTDGLIRNEKVKLMHNRINPFSFFNNIYINPSLHSPEELQNILKHEKIHVKGWHTADILAGEMNNLFYWFNPGAWLMKTAIRENLEFITDKKILQSGTDAKTYQYSLVKISTIPFTVPLANNFNFSHLKTRIKMMNKKRSPGFHLLRYLILLPVIAMAAFVINSSKAQTANPLKPSSVSVLTFNVPDSVPAHLPKDYTDFLKRNPSVERMAWTKDSDSYIPIAIIHLKDGTTERYHLNNPGEMKTAKEKYGRFPVPPPPPPPTPYPASKPTSSNNSNDTIIRNDRYYAKLAYQKAREKNYAEAALLAGESLKLNPDNGTAKAILRYIGYVKEYQAKMEVYEKERGDSSFPKVKVHYVPPVVIKDSASSATTSPDDYYAQLAYQKAREKNYAEAALLAGKSLKLNPDNGTAKAVLRYIGHMKEYEEKMEEYKKGQGDSGSTSSSPNNYRNITFTSKTDTVPTNTLNAPYPGINKPLFPENVLYVIDGKEENKGYPRILSPENIGSIEVFKGRSASQKYGPKAADGAIVIKTKQYLKNHPDKTPFKEE